jgi:uncharacterized lipoprotein YmbA
MKIRKTALLMMTAACAAFLCGCASTQHAKLYVLHSPKPEASVQGVDDSLAAATVMLARIRIPKYMDRPTIMLRANNTELEYSEFRRWAGPLDDELSRTISLNLTRILGSSGVTGYRAMLSDAYDYRVDIEIVRMTGVLKQEAVLAARGQVSRGDEELTTSGMTLTSYSEKLPEKSGYDEYVEAQSKMLMKLSSDIAKEIRAKAKAAPKKVGKK